MKTNNRDQKKRKLLMLTQFSILLAIEIIVCFTPLGTIPIGTLSATLSHVPVIITALTLGFSAGTGMGFAFGMCSFIYWSFVAPGIFSFIYTPFYSAGEFKGNFWSLVICFVPRILIGIVTYCIANALSKTKLPQSISFGLAGLLGSLTNTLLVLGGVWLFFGTEYFSLVDDGSGKTLPIILGMTVLTNGIPEAVIGALSGALIALPVKKATEKIRF
ncbi:MAG: ECF transporter S component [Clostridia bacterium]|nr:ECF transporter S component [Clostridia bacterium]MBR6780662.1 ECF transporter S component [Clostridia bacterium]